MLPSVSREAIHSASELVLFLALLGDGPVGLPDDTGRGAAGFLVILTGLARGPEIRQGFGISNDLLRQRRGPPCAEHGCIFLG